MALKKSEKTLLKVLAGVAVVSGIILYRVYGPQKAEPVATTETTTTTETPPSTKNTNGANSAPAATPRGNSIGGGSAGVSQSSKIPTGVRLDEFEKNNTLNSCWVLIEGEVYNISNFLENNQNDFDLEIIVQYCGTLGFEAGFLVENTQLIEVFKENAQNLGEIKA
jgi:hypothetical protein